MEDSRLQVGEEDYANILLGIFIPTQIVNGKKAKKRKPASGTANCGNGIESSGKSRKRRFSSDHFVEDSRLKSKRQKVPEVKELSHNKGEEVEVKSVSHKKMKKRPKNGRKQSQDSSSTSAKTATDREDALDYLHRWDWGISSWTFRKKTQYWLLQNACNKSQVRQNTCTVMKLYSLFIPRIASAVYVKHSDHYSV